MTDKVVQISFLVGFLLLLIATYFLAALKIETVLLFANLLVLWWYASRTSKMASATEEMAQETRLAARAAQTSAEATNRSAEVANQQLKLFRLQHLQTNRPIVFTVRRDVEDHPGRFHYFLSNVGGGIAVNVWYVGLDLKGQRCAPQPLGALASGQMRLLPPAWGELLCSHAGDLRHALVAEGITSRTRRWTVTLNVRGPQAGDEITSAWAQVDSQRPHNISDYVEEHWELIDSQLVELRSWRK